MGIFEEHYDNYDLDKNSDYASLSEKHLVIETEHMSNALHSVLKYLDEGGTDLDIIRGNVMDGIYESRIWGEWFKMKY